MCGRWIWFRPDAEKDEFGVFFDRFAYCVGRVCARVSCSGDYALRINGALVSFGQYPDYEDDKICDEVDLTPFLRLGENTLRIDAWHIGEDFSTHRAMPAGLWYEVRGGAELLCASGEHTLCALSPDYVSHREKKITVQLGYSYCCDMRGKDTVPALHAAVLTHAFGTPRLRPVKKLSTEPTSFGVLIDPKKRLYDLGRERSGLLHIRFRASAGTAFSVAYGEHIEDGEVRYSIDGRDFSVGLIASGGDDEFLGVFRRLGGRYLQIVSDGEVAVESIGIKETPYPTAKRGFVALDGLRRRIYDTCVRTLELCMHEHYEDTPWREQALYIMDARNQMLCGYYTFDNPEFVAASLRLMLGGQRGNGLFELCFPARVPITIPSFSLMLPIAIREYLEHTGDLALVAEAREKLEKMLSYFEQNSDENGLTVPQRDPALWHFYEWADGLDDAFFSGESRSEGGCECLLNCYFSLSEQAMAALAEALGDHAAAEARTVRAQTIDRAIFDSFFDAEKGLFVNGSTGGYSELNNALAILCGACPADRRVAIAEHAARGCDWTPCTLSMRGFKYDAMLMADAARFRDGILREIDEDYGAMLRQGATSFWETLKGASDFSGAGSLCHGWSALPVYYYTKLLSDR